DATGKDGGSGDLPVVTPANHVLKSGTMESLRILNADKSIQIDVKFDGPANATIQDSRRWGDSFSLLIHAHTGILQKGATSKFGLTLKATGQPDQTVAEFKLGYPVPNSTVLGIGGNYCFNLDTAVKDYTLAQLKPRFARTEISLAAWAPEKGAAPNPAA